MVLQWCSRPFFTPHLSLFKFNVQLISAWGALTGSSVVSALNIINKTESLHWASNTTETLQKRSNRLQPHVSGRISLCVNVSLRGGRRIMKGDANLEPAESGRWTRTGDATRTLRAMRSWPHSASSNGIEKDDG